MATKTLRVFAEYTSTGFVPMPTAGNIDYGFTLGSTFPATTPATYQTDNPDLVVTVTAMTDFYVWIRVNGSAWNPSYTRNVRVYPDSPNINNVVMNMIIATGPAGVSSYTQIVQTSNRLYFNGATTDAVYNSKFAGKTYINELNFGTAPGLATVATSGAYADLTGKPSLATVATSGLFTDLSSKPSGTAPLSYNSGTNSFVITQANTSTNGFLSSTDWNTFNNKYLLPAGGTTAQYVNGAGTLTTFPTTLDSKRLIISVRNETGATLTKGTVVYIVGIGGNTPLVSKAIASSDSTSAQTLGVLDADINNNQSGTAVLVGQVATLDTSSFTEGVQLYLSGTTAGTYTSTKSLAPTHLVYVGIVTRSHPTQGVIEVKIQNGYELNEIHDVQISSPTDKDILYRDSATSLWKHASISTVLGYTPYNGTNTSIKALFSASAPLSYSDGVYSISQATTASNGYLSSADWNTFNGKESALTFSTPLVRTTNTISINQASASTNGYLSSTDWNTFNNKSSTNGTVTSVAMTVPTGLSISGTPITTSGTLALSFSAGYSLPSDATQATWTAKQAALNGTGFVKATGTTISYDNTNYLPLTGGVMSGSIGFSDSGKRGIYGSMGVNDNWFIGAVAFTTDSGFVEIATGDDGNEPIYVRQYNGDPYTTGTIARTATILDGSGNTIFPNTLTATTLVKSGGTSSQYLMADGSVSTLTNPVTGTGTTNTIAYWTSTSAIGALALATYPSLTELAYVKGVTSSIQTQLNAKASTLSGTINYISKFTSSSAIGNSLIYDNGTQIGIGTSSPNQLLTLSAAAYPILGFSIGSTSHGYIGSLNATGIILNSQQALPIMFYTNDTERIRISDSKGQLLFGTSVTTGFDKGIVFNSVSSTSGLLFQQNGVDKGFVYSGGGELHMGSSSNNILLYTNGSERMRITSTGNVGIGTTSPDSKLNVVGGRSTFYANSEAFAINVKYDSAAARGYWIGSPASGIMSFSNADGTERLRITDAGNVGIGRTPTTKLDVYSATGNTFSKLESGDNSRVQFIAVNSLNSANFGVESTAGATYIGTLANAALIGSNGNYATQLVTNNTARLTITSAGNVGIGTSSPATQLSILSLTPSSSTLDAIFNITNDVDSNFRIFVTGGAASDKRTAIGATTNTALAFITNTTERMRITSGGNILMGTTSDSGYRLYVSGTIYATGNITANSDLTLKKNLKLIDNPIDKLMQLNGYAYQWKANDEHQYGVIAQEVEKVLPYAVQTGNDKIKGVAYNQIIPVLIEAIKTQQAEINTLKSKLA